MFWSQIEDSSINDILIKKDLTLEEILDHESLLQECRSQNEKLINIFILPCNYCKLLKYVLVTPSEDCNENIRFKYSSLSCEVLTSDIPTINMLLIKGFDVPVPEDTSDMSFGKPFIDQLYDFLSLNEYINPLTMSFCIKILLNILKSDNELVMKSIIEKQKYLDVFLSHIDSNAIVHFLTEFVQCEDEVVEIRKNWLVDNKFLLKLAHLLGLTEYRNNSVQLVFYNIIWCMSYGLTSKIISTELIAQLNEPEFLNVIFAHISNFQSDSSLVSTCLKVIKNIIEMEIKRKEESINLCLDLVKEHFQSFVKLLNEPPKQMYESMPTTVGVFKPFGPTRIEIVSLIECLLKLEKVDFNNLIIESKILHVTMNHLFEYKWNSQFHLNLLNVIKVIFSDFSAENKYKSLQKNLVQEFHIYEWVFNLLDNLETIKPRPGYSGILWIIGNLLDNLLNNDICDELLPEKADISSKWSRVVDEFLKPKNKSTEPQPMKFDSEICDIDLDLNIVEIGEADIEASERNSDSISEYFRSKSDKLDEIFGTSLSHKSDNFEEIFGKSLIDNDYEWVTNELEMPTAPVDDFVSESKFTDESDDSTSSDEESPAFIRQKSLGKAAKYISSDVHCNARSDITDLPDIPAAADEEFSTIDFSDPWEKSSTEKLMQDNWAKF